MKKNLILTAGILMIVFPGSFAQSQGNDSLSLKSVLELIMMNQPLLRQAEDEIKIAEANINEQESFDLPTVNFEVTDNVIGPIPAIPFGNEVFKLAPRNNFDGHVSLVYLLFDFNKRGAALDLLKSYKLTAEERINLVKNELSYRAVQVFFSVLFFERSRKIKEEQINVLRKHVDDAQKRVNTGTAVDLDVLTTEVRAAAAENELINIDQDLDKSRLALKNLLDMSGNEQLNLSGNFDSTSAELNDKNLVQTAFGSREELKIAQLNEQSSELQKKSIQLNNVPTLNLIGTYGFKNGYLPDLDAYLGNWVLGARLSVPIFNGNRTDALVESAEARVQSAGHNIESLKREIEMEVKQSVVDVKSSLEKLKRIKVQIEQAQEALNKAQIQYENGIIKNLDLLDAEASLTQTRLLYLSALYQITVNSYSLKKAMGEKIW